MSTESPSPPSLSRLARTTSTPPRSRPWKPLAFLLLMLCLFAAVAIPLFRDTLRPGVPVTLTRVLLLPGAADEEEQQIAGSGGTPLFQSSGWIEADPWLIRVPALADGIVESVHFNEGDLVTEGQLLVKLISEDQELEVARLRHRVQQASDQCEALTASVSASERERDAIEAHLEATSAGFKEVEDRWNRVRILTGREISEEQRISAEQGFLQHSAEVAEAKLRLEQASFRLEQQRQLAESHTHERDALKEELNLAELNLSRMEIRSPVSGRVQVRLASPGMKKMRGMDEPDSATVAKLYHPDRLQVRVDVPLAEAGGLQVGQPARISTAMLPGKEFAGTVTRIVGEADLQRNTLQAKVAIMDPDPRLRPDVLCRVAFLSAAGGNPSSVPGASGRERLWIPADLVPGTASRAEIWVADPLTQTVSSRSVELGPALQEGLREVREGLRPNEWIVLTSEQPLETGDRVQADHL